MVWNDFDAFLAMGGYGVYVWSAIGGTLACMAWEAHAVARRWRSVQAARARAEQASAEPARAEQAAMSHPA